MFTLDADMVKEGLESLNELDKYVASVEEALQHSEDIPHETLVQLLSTSIASLKVISQQSRMVAEAAAVGLQIDMGKE